MFVLKKIRHNFGSTKWCIVCTPKPDLTTGTSQQRNHAKPPRNLVLGLKKWIGHVCCKKTRRNVGRIKWCIVCTPKPVLTTGTSRQRNRAKPPRNLVLGLTGSSPQRNRTKPPRNLVLGLKKWIGQVRCEKTRRNFGKHKVVHFMHPKTRSHNGYLPATESRETTQKLSFGPNG